MRSKHAVATEIDGDTSLSDRVSRLASLLPWVVERPRLGDGTDGRVFGVELALRERRQVWLATHLRVCRFDGSLRDRVGVVLPTEAAIAHELGGIVRTVAPLPHEHAFVVFELDARGAEVEALVLAAYRYAVHGIVPPAPLAATTSHSSPRRTPCNFRSNPEPGRSTTRTAASSS
jgi:hypothetical protein